MSNLWNSSIKTEEMNLKIGQTFFDGKGNLCKLVGLLDVPYGERGAEVVYFKEWESKFGEKRYRWTKRQVRMKFLNKIKETPLYKVLNV